MNDKSPSDSPADQGAQRSSEEPSVGRPAPPVRESRVPGTASNDLPDSVGRTEQAFSDTEAAARKLTTAMNQALPPEIPDLGENMPGTGAEGIGLLEDVQLQVRIELGRTRMLVEDVLRLGSGAVVELDKAAGDPVDIYVNGRRVARGEVLVLNENFCVRVSEIVDPQARTA